MHACQAPDTYTVTSPCTYSQVVVSYIGVYACWVPTCLGNWVNKLYLQLIYVISAYLSAPAGGRLTHFTSLQVYLFDPMEFECF